MTKLANISDASDQDVVARAREGDEAACRELVRRYGPPVFDRIYGMVGIRELAEDLTQETFAKAFEALEVPGLFSSHAGRACCPEMLNKGHRYSNLGSQV